MHACRYPRRTRSTLKPKKRNEWKDEAAEERRREGYMSMNDEIIMREMIAMYN
jgi:hypothetical protein